MKTQTERGIRFDISCEVCRDLMPLVRDGVASADSEALVRAHTERCGGCRTMLESETPPEHSMPDDARVLRRLRWRLLAQSVLFALVGVLGALWLTSRAGDVYLAWWLPLVGGVLLCPAAQVLAGAGCSGGVCAFVFFYPKHAIAAVGFSGAVCVYGAGGCRAAGHRLCNRGAAAFCVWKQEGGKICRRQKALTKERARRTKAGLAFRVRKQRVRWRFCWR